MHITPGHRSKMEKKCSTSFANRMAYRSRSIIDSSDVLEAPYQVEYAGFGWNEYCQLVVLKPNKTYYLSTSAILTYDFGNQPVLPSNSPIHHISCISITFIVSPLLKVADWGLEASVNGSDTAEASKDSAKASGNQPTLSWRIRETHAALMYLPILVVLCLATGKFDMVSSGKTTGNVETSPLFNFSIRNMAKQYSSHDN
uniref:Uncharacterized protein n=1 Tax=Romanomermis culicivorax TaxID=13658 RepID=A0A915KKL7_ROMCU